MFIYCLLGNSSCHGNVTESIFSFTKTKKTSKCAAIDPEGNVLSPWLLLYYVIIERVMSSMKLDARLR